MLYTTLLCFLAACASAAPTTEPTAAGNGSTVPPNLRARPRPAPMPAHPAAGTAVEVDHKRQLGNLRPQCDTGDSQFEQTCDIFGSDGLSWATIDFQWPKAKWDNWMCSGKLVGVSCFTGSGFTASRYNRWECMDTCPPLGKAAEGFNEPRAPPPVEDWMLKTSMGTHL